MAEEPRPERTAAPSASATASAAAGHAARGARRLRASWSALDADHRLAAVAALGLFVSMLLPWYEQTATGVNPTSRPPRPVTASDSLSAFQVFSWVEAAVLLVSIAVLALCFARGERRTFQLPGGDGTVVMGGGLWVCLLVFIRQLDKPAPDQVAGLSATIGVQWGIFIAFLLGLLLAYAGLRMRQARAAAPSAPREEPPAPRRAAARAQAAPPDQLTIPEEAPTAVVRRRAPAAEAEQLTFDE